MESESYTSGLLAGQGVGRAYDSQGRLQTLTLPGGVTVGYTYGSNGELATVTTAGGDKDH